MGTKSCNVLGNMCVLTLQIVTYLLLHFLGFIFSATNKLWKGKNKRTIGDIWTADNMQLLLDYPGERICSCSSMFSRVLWLSVAKRFIKQAKGHSFKTWEGLSVPSPQQLLAGCQHLAVLCDTSHMYLYTFTSTFCVITPSNNSPGYAEGFLTQCAYYCVK